MPLWKIIIIITTNVAMENDSENFRCYYQSSDTYCYDIATNFVGDDDLVWMTNSFYTKVYYGIASNFYE